MNILQDLFALDQDSEGLFSRIMLIRKQDDWTLQVLDPLVHTRGGTGLRDMKRWNLVNKSGNLLEAMTAFLSEISVSKFSRSGYYIFGENDLRKFLAGILVGDIGLLIEVREKMQKQLMELLRVKNAVVFSSKSS
jgi:hypothetical protein